MPIRSLVIATGLTIVALILLPIYNAIAKAPLSYQEIGISPPIGFVEQSLRTSPTYPQADAQLSWAPYDKGGEFEAYLAYYVFHNENHSSLSILNKDYDEALWQRQRVRREVLETSVGKVSVKIEHLASPYGGKVIAKTYWVAGSFTSSEFEVQIRQSIADLTFADRQSAVLIVEQLVEMVIGVRPRTN